VSANEAMVEGTTELSLFGGPLHRVGCRLGLVRDGTNSTALGLVLGVSPWIVLLMLALVEGFGHLFFSIEAIGAHVRLLLAIPLLFVCEEYIGPRFDAFVQGIVRSKVLPETARPALQYEIARVERWKDAWLPEAMWLLVAVLVALGARDANFLSYLPGISVETNAGAVGATTWTSQWYWLVCMPLFRFLLLRWLWRIALWSFFLWRVSKLDLRLVPIHPDRAGGLGYLELVHTEFTPLIAAMSAAVSASLAPDVASGRMTFDAIYPVVAFTLLIDAVLFIGPLCLFSRTLWRCKVKGLSDYGALAEQYVNAFDRKWLDADAASAEPLLGTADIQSLADLSNSVGIVRDMRLVIVSATTLIYLAVAALLPLLPLVLLKYPLADLLARFARGLSGL
jgi:hypothetical protein